MTDELTAETTEECPHGDRCCQGEPCNGPQTTCFRCKSEVPAVDSCPVCDGDGSALDLEYVHGLAKLSAARGERITELEKRVRQLEAVCADPLRYAPDCPPDEPDDVEPIL
jgi:hypothetical protein